MNNLSDVISVGSQLNTGDSSSEKNKRWWIIPLVVAVAIAIAAIGLYAMMAKPKPVIKHTTKGGLTALAFTSGDWCNYEFRYGRKYIAGDWKPSKCNDNDGLTILTQFEAFIEKKLREFGVRNPAKAIAELKAKYNPVVPPP